MMMARRHTRRLLEHQRGVAVVEMAIVLPVLLFLMFAVTEIGRVLYQYNTLNKTSRDVARYLASEATVGSTDVILINSTLEARAKRLAVYGNVGGVGPPLIYGLDIDNVTIRAVDVLHVGVDITLEYAPLFGAKLPAFGFATEQSMAFEMRSSVIMRAL